MEDLKPREMEFVERVAYLVPNKQTLRQGLKCKYCIWKGEETEGGKEEVIQGREAPQATGTQSHQRCTPAPSVIG